MSFTISIWRFELHFHITIHSISFFLRLKYNGLLTNHYYYGVHIEYYGWGIYYGKNEYFKWFPKYAEKNRLKREKREKEYKESEEYKKLFSNGEEIINGKV